MEQSISTLAVRVDKLERDEAELFGKVNAAIVAQATVNEKLCSMITTLEEVKTAVGNLEGAPSRKLEVIFRACITALISAIIGYFAAKIK